MKYQKAFFTILIFDLLLIILLTISSSQFILKKINKIRSIDPEIMAQYEVKLETELFMKIFRQMRESTD